MGWNARFVLLAATLLALALPATGFPEPIPPQPLWGQVEGAELVVLARVESKERLRVIEVWKGTAGPELPVSSPENLVCPAPAYLLPGETVIAFLGRGPEWSFGEDDGRWHPYGLSYGLVYADDAGVDHHRRLVRAAVALQRRGQVPDTVRTAWLLDAASHAATRWNGLHDLLDSKRWDGEKGRWEEFTPLAARLTAAQRAELARAFVTDPGWGSDLPDLLPLLRGVEDPRLEGTIVGVLDRSVDDRQSLSWVGDVLGPVARWFGLAAPALPERLWSLPDEEREDAVRDAWFDLRTRILTRGQR